MVTDTVSEFQFFGSNDGVNWKVLCTNKFTNGTRIAGWNQSVSNTWYVDKWAFDLDERAYYRSYRFQWTALGGTEQLPYGGALPGSANVFCEIDFA